MFKKLFTRKANNTKKMYEVQTVLIGTDIIETTITDAQGLTGLVLNGYDIIATKEVER